MTAFLNAIRLCLIAGALVVAGLAIAALFGFAFPTLDLLNHAQLLLFPASLLGVPVLALALRGQARTLALMIGFAGLAASAYVLAPELAALVQPRPAAPASGTIRLMTHNVFGMNDNAAQVRAAITAEDPDIIVLQEYLGEQASDLHPLLLADYPYSAQCQGGKRANLGLYSRIPFEQIEDDACPSDAYGTNRTGHILARFMAPGDKPFSVLTTHMDWPLPVVRQNTQLAALSSVLADTEGPLIVAGDFNSTPWSYALRDFVADNALVRETISLPTFPVRWHYLGAWRPMIPILPLDHVLTRGGIVVHGIDTGARTASDHLPVVASFSVP